MSKVKRDVIEREARLWHVRLAGGSMSAEESRAFDAWKAAHPAHGEALSYISVIDEIAGECAQAVAADMPVVAAVREGRSRIAVFGLVAAALVAGFIGALQAGWLEPIFAPKPVLYASAVGEMKEVQLADGSALHLSADTRVEVVYGREKRLLRLLSGRAVFDAAPEAERPFIVDVDGTEARAVGTSFDVHKYPGGLSVSVIDGAVAVTRTERVGGTEPEVLLKKGQQIAYTRDNEKGHVSSAPPESYAVWQQGLLEFNMTMLDSVVADLTRHTRGRIELADASLANLPVTAVFVAGDFEEAISLLEQILPVKAVKQADDIIILSAKSAVDEKSEK